MKTYKSINGTKMTVIKTKFGIYAECSEKGVSVKIDEFGKTGILPSSGWDKP